MPPLPIEEYQVGWVCALLKELTATRVMLDEEHEPYTSQVLHDNNSYILRRIHGHNVVMAYLPTGVYGTVSAATVATNILRTFTSIRFGLMVGIGGGIPSSHKGGDIRLGDVVVSQPDGTYGGVVQYDLRKNLGDRVFERKGMLRPPPTLLLTALANLQSRHQINVEGHQDGGHCTECQNGIINRQPREDHSPEVHYGVITSGNELMKNVVERARLGREFGAKCVEMEAARLMTDFPYVMEYAAATATGFTKELLAIVKPAEVMSVKRAVAVIKGLNHPIDARQYWLAFNCVASHVDTENWDHLSTIRYRRITRHTERLGAMVLLALLLKQQVRYNAAEQMYVRALQGYEEALGLDHISTLDTVHNLGLLYANQGVLYANQGKLVKVEKMYVRALKGYEEALGPDHTSTLNTVNNLGVLYAD
ncbi:Tetratricopeptide repeat-containing protein [Cladophialophora immunda]|nr:Tetratricopeptide repeat-containing protein [Cladophialophora immunda]